MSNKLAIALPIVLLCMIAYMGWRWDSARKRALIAEDETIALKAQKAGLEQALAMKPIEVIKLVEKIVPKEVIRMVHDKEIIPVETVRIVTKEVPVTIATPGGGSLDTSVRVEGGFFLGTTPLGKPYWTKKLFVHIAGAEPVDFSDDPGITVAFSHDIEKMIAAAALAPPRLVGIPRPLRAWRAGWTIGAGLCVAALPDPGKPSVCIAALWGLQM